MATVEGITFRLERFGWGAPDKLEVIGRWSGLEDEPSGEAVLVGHTDGADHRLEAIPGSSRYGHGGRWSVAFRCDPESLRFAFAELEVDGLVLELPRPSNSPRRFGRPLLEARRVSQARQTVPAAVGERSPATPEGEPPAGAADGVDEGASPLDLYAELLKAREDLDEANAAAAHAREEAQLARHDAERERERRRGEAQRLREGLDTARALADEQLARIEEQAQERAAELERVAQQLAAERLARSSMADELAGLRAQLERAGQWEVSLREARQELGKARDEVDAARAHAAEVGHELQAAREQLDSATQAREQAQADFEAARARTDEEVHRLQSQLAEAHDTLAAVGDESRRRQEELERLRGRMLEMQRLSEEVERLRESHDALRRRAAEVDEIQQELLAARESAVRAERRAEELEQRLENVRRALEAALPVQPEAAG